MTQVACLFFTFGFSHLTRFAQKRLNVPYPCTVLQKTKEKGAEGHSDDDAVGGIFRLKKKKDSQSLGTMHERDCSLEVSSMSVRDWSQPEVLESIRDCFVTGKWRNSEDAETLLRDDDECMCMG